MKKSTREFLQIVIRALVAALIATFLYRRLHLKVPGLDPAQTPEERLDESLGELNAREMREGRGPFVITRVVIPAAGVGGRKM